MLERADTTCSWIFRKNLSCERACRSCAFFKGRNPCCFFSPKLCLFSLTRETWWTVKIQSTKFSRFEFPFTFTPPHPSTHAQLSAYLWYLCDYFSKWWNHTRIYRLFSWLRPFGPLSYFWIWCHVGKTYDTGECNLWDNIFLSNFWETK